MHAKNVRLLILAAVLFCLWIPKDFYGLHFQIESPTVAYLENGSELPITFSLLAPTSQNNPNLSANLTFRIELEKQGVVHHTFNTVNFNFVPQGSSAPYPWNYPSNLNYRIPCDLEEGLYNVNFVILNWQGNVPGAVLSFKNTNHPTPINYGFGFTGTHFSHLYDVQDMEVLTHQMGIGTCADKCYATALAGVPNPIAPPYTYLWHTGETTHQITNICGLEASVTVTNGGGCVAEEEVDMDYTFHLDGISTVTTNSLCEGGVCNGTIDLTPMIPQGTYNFNLTYLWDDGQTTEDVTGVCGGTRMVTITAENSGNTCDMVYEVDVTADVIIDDNPTVTNELCVQSIDGSILVQPSDGLAPYTYNWSTGATTNQIDGLQMGSYDLTISDAQGCEKETTYQIDNDYASILPRASNSSLLGDQGHDIVADDNGDVYVVGEFGKQSNLDGFTVSSGTGNKGLYVMKYDHCGQPAWVSVSTSVLATDVSGVSIARDGNDLYVVGTFSGATGTVNFISDANSISVTSSSMFVAKLNKDDGSFTFVQTSYGGLTQPVPQSINVAPSGDVLVCGGSGASQNQVFVMKCSSINGSALTGWPKISTGSVGDMAYDVVENNDGIYVTGEFHGTLTLSGQSATATGNSDAFASRLSTTGTGVWMAKAGTQSGSSAKGRGITFVNSEIYITGDFSGQLSSSFGSAINQSSNITNLLVAKLSSTGVAQWMVKMDDVNSGGNLIEAKGVGIAPSDFGNVYLTGTYQGFGIFFNGYVPVNNGGTGNSKDVFVASINSSGNVDWATVGYGAGNYEAGGVAAGNFHAYSTGKITAGIMTLPPSSNITHSSTGGSGYYLIRHEAANGNAFKSSEPMTLETAESVNDDVDFDFEVYPNPSHGLFTARWSIDQLVDYRIVDIQGKVLQQGSLHYGENLLDLSGQHSGLYFLQVESPEFSEVTKLFVR